MESLIRKVVWGGRRPSRQGAETASELLKEMQRKGLKPDLYSYGSAIHACAKAGDPTEASRLLRAMEANQVCVSWKACSAVTLGVGG